MVPLRPSTAALPALPRIEVKVTYVSEKTIGSCPGVALLCLLFTLGGALVALDGLNPHRGFITVLSCTLIASAALFFAVWLFRANSSG